MIASQVFNSSYMWDVGLINESRHKGIGRLAGVGLLVKGIFQTLGAGLAVLPLKLFGLKYSSSRTMGQYAVKHICAGVKNIGRGIVFALPFYIGIWAAKHIQSQSFTRDKTVLLDAISKCTTAFEARDYFDPAFTSLYEKLQHDEDVVYSMLAKRKELGEFINEKDRAENFSFIPKDIVKAHMIERDFVVENKELLKEKFQEYNKNQERNKDSRKEIQILAFNYDYVKGVRINSIGSVNNLLNPAKQDYYLTHHAIQSIDDLNKLKPKSNNKVHGYITRGHGMYFKKQMKKGLLDKWKLAKDAKFIILTNCSLGRMRLDNKGHLDCVAKKVARKTQLSVSALSTVGSFSIPVVYKKDPDNEEILQASFVWDVDDLRGSLISVIKLFKTDHGIDVNRYIFPYKGKEIQDKDGAFSEHESDYVKRLRKGKNIKPRYVDCGRHFKLKSNEIYDDINALKKLISNLSSLGQKDLNQANKIKKRITDVINNSDFAFKEILSIYNQCKNNNQSQAIQAIEESYGFQEYFSRAFKRDKVFKNLDGINNVLMTIKNTHWAAETQEELLSRRK